MTRIAVSDLEIEYESCGDPARPTILLVMGLGMQLVAWPDAFCNALAERGFHVVRFDNRDIGLSTHLDDLGFPDIARQAIRYFLHLPIKSPYYIEDMARDTLGFVNALGLRRVHVMGASMGGMIAQNLAALAPDRVLSLVSIMSTTGSRRLPGPKARALKAMLLPPAPEGDVEAATTRLMELFRIIGSTTYPAKDDYLRGWCERHVRRSYHPAGGTRQLLAIAASGDRTAVVRRIKVPALVLHGDEDPLLRTACGEAEFEVIHGMGHDFPVELLPSLSDRVAAFCGRHS